MAAPWCCRATRNEGRHHILGWYLAPASLSQGLRLTRTSSKSEGRPGPRTPRKGRAIFSHVRSYFVTSGNVAISGVADTGQSLRKLSSRDVPGKPHGAMTSSLTKWSRMTASPSPSSKWHRTVSRICSRRSPSIIVSASVKMDTPRALAVYPPSASSITNTSSFDAALRNSLAIRHSSDVAWLPTTCTMHGDPTAERADRARLRQGGDGAVPPLHLNCHQLADRIVCREWSAVLSLTTRSSRRSAPAVWTPHSGSRENHLPRNHRRFASWWTAAWDRKEFGFEASLWRWGEYGP